VLEEQRNTLAPDDWTNAALAAIAEGGTGRIAVEALARELGTTKGSFYWHFKNRDALVDAALARWEETDAREIDERAAGISDPRERLRDLFAAAFGNAGAGRIEVSLLADGRRPAVAATLGRVTARRLEATAEMFSQLGFGLKAAHNRALVAYSAYLGLFAVGQADPNALPQRGAALGEFVEELLDLLTRV
jgi:AcrR family transcriptional regulator